MLSCVVNHRREPSRTSPFRHRDGKPVTASPLESVLTKCDPRISFRFRFYENTGVSVGSLNVPTFKPSNLSTCFYLSPLFSYSSGLFYACQELKPFVFMQFHTLCEKHPGVGYPPSFTQDQNEAQRHQDEPDRQLSTPFSSTSHRPAPTLSGSRITSHFSAGCRPPAQMLRFGVP